VEVAQSLDSRAVRHTFWVVGAVAALVTVVTKWAVSTDVKPCVCHRAVLTIVSAFTLPGV
jgi:hypothetical protein